RTCGAAAAFRFDLVEARFERACERLRFLRASDEGAERADHGEDAGEIALVEEVDGEPGAREFGDDRALDVGEGQDQIRLELQDARDGGREEGRDARLFLAHPRRADGITRDADDAVLLAEEVEGLYGLLGEADDPLGRIASQERAD